MPRYNTPTRGSPARSQQHTKDAEYHHALGLEFAAVGRYEKASEHFEKAMNMEPSNEAHRDALRYCCEQHLGAPSSSSDTKTSLAPWLKARLRHTARQRRGGERQSLDAHEAERQARLEATARQNRDAAAAFFEKAEQAVDADDLPTALRRVERAIELHPPGGDEDAREALQTYREWREAIVAALEQEEEEDDEEYEAPTETAKEAERRKQREERERRRREVEEDKAKRRAEKEEERARLRAREKANGEAAEACVQRAAASDDPAQAVKLIRKAVTLRRWNPRYRYRLLRALIAKGYAEALQGLSEWWAARGGLYGYLGAVLTVTLSLAFIYICLRQLGLWLTRRYCTHIPRVSSPQLQSRLCNTGKGISSRLGRLASARLITLPSLPQINNLLTFFYLLNPALLLVLLLPIALMLLLSPPTFHHASNWSPMWIRIKELAKLPKRAVQWVWRQACAMYETLHKMIDDWEQEERSQQQREREEVRRRREGARQQQSYQRDQHWESHRSRGGSSNGGFYNDWERQQRQRNQQSQQQQRSSRPSPRSSEQQQVEALRERAMRLPAGDIKRVLLSGTHYEALGVPRSCTGAEAKKAFHKLALRLHPDKNKSPLSEEAFKRVEEAHRTISDERLRREYELTLPAMHTNGGTGSRPRQNGGAPRHKYHWE